MKRILCVWFPQWPVQRVRQAQPELRGRPVILYADVPGRGQRVVACSSEAFAAGCRIGQPLANVAVTPSLRGKSPGEGQAKKAYQLHQPSKDQQTLEQLAVACERFSPTIGLEESPQPECLLLDITGLATLFGSEEQLVSKLTEHLHRQGLQPKLAVANTVGAAWALAKYGSSPRAEKLHEGPKNDQLSVDYFPLAELPIEGLRLTPSIIDQFHQLGIATIGQITQLPRASLASRFGDQVARRLDQFFGHTPEPIKVHQPQPTLATTWDLEHPTDRVEILKAAISQLLQRLEGQLAGHHQGAVELHCNLQTEQGEQLAIPLFLFEPMVKLHEVLPLFDLQWGQKKLNAKINKIRLAITATATLVERQRELFDEAPQRNHHELAALVNRLSHRLGQTRVVRPYRRSDAQPEKACRYVPLTGASDQRPRHTKAAPPNVGERPLRLLNPPEPIEVMTLQPGQTPATIRHGQRFEKIVNHWGPERIQTGWWRGRSVERDYFQIEITTGDRLWIFRRLGDARWFLHGQF